MMTNEALSRAQKVVLKWLSGTGTDEAELRPGQRAGLIAEIAEALDNHPNAVARSGVITVSGVTLHVHVLNDGSRILEAAAIAKLLEALANGAPLYPDVAEVAAQFIKGVGR
jgi:hypothetical protein